jgi:hypothetical protein
MLKFKLLFASLVACALASCASSKPIGDNTGLSDQYDQATQYQMEQSHRKVNDNIGSGPIGTKTNPIKCEGLEGANAYLKKLQGPKREPVTFSELTDNGVGPFGSLVYVTDVGYTGASGLVQVQVFFDIDFTGYHESKAVPGFLLR